MTSAGAKLRNLLKKPNIVVMPGIYDGYSARIVEHFGFEAAFVTGAGLAESAIGQPDIGLMGMEVPLRTSQVIASCCGLPFITDCDTGYGNAINVFYMVRLFERAGAAGIMIEDQLWPKRCGHLKGKQVIDAEEMVEKVRAASDARRDKDFLIKARTDAFAIHGIQETVRRLNLYEEAGADVLFADALLSEEDIGTVARNTTKPLCVNMGFGIRSRATTPLISAKKLGELGVRLVIYPRLLTACALQGMKNGLQVLKDAMHQETVVEHPELAASFEEIHELFGLEDYGQLEQRYLTKDQIAQKYVLEADK